MDEVKKGELDRVTLKTDVLRKYFPKSYTNKADGGKNYSTFRAMAEKTRKINGKVITYVYRENDKGSISGNL